MLKKLLAAALSAALMPAAAIAATNTATNATTNAATNAYPTKPVRFVVPYPAGGPLDTVFARWPAAKTGADLGDGLVR